MPDTPATPAPQATRDRVLVALDVESVKEAEALLDRLAGSVTGVKIGSQLFTAAGPAAVEATLKRGLRVFLDLKFHDIPNTVAGAVREAARLGVFMLNVHASGGVAMMRAAAEAAQNAAAGARGARPLVLGVTVLTSLDRRGLNNEAGLPGTVEAHVLRLAESARVAGLDGCVASPREIRLLRVALGPRWVIVTPGVRPGGVEREEHRPGAPSAGASGGVERGTLRTPLPTDDQARVATPAAAIRAGADYLVVGRPITAAPDPRAAAAAIIDELTAAGAH